MALGLGEEESRTPLWDARSSEACFAPLQRRWCSSHLSSLRFIDTSRMMPWSNSRVFKIRRTRNGKALAMTTNETEILAVAAELARNDPASELTQVRTTSDMQSTSAQSRYGDLTVCAALAIVFGLHSRVTAETRLRESAQASAIPYVDVILRKRVQMPMRSPCREYVSLQRHSYLRAHKRLR